MKEKNSRNRLQHQDFLQEHEKVWISYQNALILQLYLSLGVLYCSVVKYLTCNPGVLVLSCTGSPGFFRGSVIGRDISEPKPSNGEAQEIHELCELLLWYD